MLAALTAGLGGVIYASRPELDLHQLRRRHDRALRRRDRGDRRREPFRRTAGIRLHAVLGGIVIAAIVNGMALLGLPAAVQLMATALVLLASITVDVVVRRRGETAR